MVQFDEEYVGSRYYKCDLHMHTPFAQDWLDQTTKLKPDDDIEKIRDVAKKYLKTCYDAELEVIAITDHNFGKSHEESFITYLYEENSHVAQECGKKPLFIYPGFEIEAHVGRGSHCICIFEPSWCISLYQVDSRLTMCGLPPDQRFSPVNTPIQSSKDLSHILSTIQEKCLGLVISAHPLSNKGLLSDETAELWLQQIEFKNSNLLCIEIPASIESIKSLNVKKIIRNTHDCSAEWKRERSIACINSSDCKQLCSSDSTNSNYIGYRYTWIKMSNPSIESLRQAFLDHESRIRILNNNPEDDYSYSKIISIEVSNTKFLNLEKVVFSPNLNCIIGGRGTGKSTIIEYIRYVLEKYPKDQSPGILQQYYDELQKKIEETLIPESSINILIELDGIQYEINYSHQEKKRIVKVVGSEDPIDSTVWEKFPLKIISQGEIDKLVEERKNEPLLSLIDGYITKEQKSKIDLEIKDIVNKINNLDEIINQVEEKELLKKGLITENLHLEVQLNRLHKAKEKFTDWERYEKANNLIIGLQEKGKNIAKILSDATISIQDEINSISEPYQIEILEPNEIRNILSDLLVQLKIKIEDIILNFSEELTGDNEGQIEAIIANNWLPQYEREKEIFDQLKKELEDTGDNIDEYFELKKKKESVDNSLQEINLFLSDIIIKKEERVLLLTKLRDIWKEKTNIREKVAKNLMDKLVPDQEKYPTKKSLVEITITHQGDIDALIAIWAQFLGKKNKLNEEELRVVIEKVREKIDPSLPIHEILLNYTQKDEIIEIIEETLSPIKYSNFRNIFSDITLKKLELIQIPDSIKFNIYRTDGSFAGSIDQVSSGQKGLAIIQLLLSSGNEPILIDTPEEGLDNEGVYFELVELLRQRKETRQIISVTHNANIPVNGDAELIITLDALGKIAFDEVSNMIHDFNPNLNSSVSKTIFKYISDRNWAKKVKDCLIDKGCDDQKIVSRIISFVKNLSISCEEERIKAKEPIKNKIESLLKIEISEDDIEKITSKINQSGWESEFAKEIGGRMKPFAETIELLILSLAQKRLVFGNISEVIDENHRVTKRIGSLDNSSVKKAVQDIMEGSEHAFKKRQEKYGF